MLHRLARHEFAAHALPADTFRVVAFEGTEAVSQPYRFALELLSNDPEIAFADVIDLPATLTMFRGDEPAEVNGIVVGFEQSDKLHGRSEYPFVYRAVLAPRLSRLALSFQSRIFQNLTVEEIVGDILARANVDAEFHLSGTYAPRDFCTQYKETDLDFVQRLLEYEGIRYHFKHGDRTERLVLSDDPADAPPIAAPEALPYRQSAGLLAADAVEFVGGFVARQQLITGKAQVKDYNYRTPETPLFAEEDLGAEQTTGVHSDYGIHVADGARAKRIALVRSQEIDAGRLVMTGEGDCMRFRAGQRFDLAEHYRESFNQTYLLTGVHHVGAQPGAGGTAEADARGYRNTFTCVPATVAYRPPRLTPEPKLPGVLTARVESGGGDYAPVDDQGRYRVRMPFDLGDAGAAQASKPVRLAQPYSGPGYGQHFPVHKDAEMVVACVDGNVDRVLGLSTIYNPTQFSPVTSSNAAQNVLRSWGKNELTFDDTIGSENIYMHGTKDHNVEIANDENERVGANRTARVGNDETLAVGRDQAEEIGRDRMLTIGANESIVVAEDRSLTVGANLSESVGTYMSLSVGASKDETVTLASTLTIGAAYLVSIGAAKSESIGGPSAETVGGSKALTVGSDSSTSAGGTIHLTAGKDFALGVGKKATITVADDAVVQAGKNLTIKAGKKAVIEVADELTLKCGSAEIVLKKNGDISIKGKKIDIKGSGNVTLKGSKLAQN